MKEENKPKKRPLAACKEKLSHIPWGYLLFALTFELVGLCFILFTSQSIDVMCYCIGGVTIAAAVVNVVLILAKKQRGGAFYVKMLLCILAVICGVVVLVSKNSSLEYIVAVCALMIIVDCSFKLQTAIKMRSVKAGLWWTILIFVLADYVLGAYLIKFYVVDQPKIMLVLLGVALMIDGAMNFLTPIYLHTVAKKKKQKKEQKDAPPAEGQEGSQEEK